MPTIESFDDLLPADIAATDFMYARSSAEAEPKDRRFAFGALMRQLIAAADAAAVRLILGVFNQATATATLDFGSISAAATVDLTITVTGAAVGDAVAIGLPAAPAAGIVFFGFVSGANTVTIRAMNITGSGVDPSSATYRATVIKAM